MPLAPLWMRRSVGEDLVHRSRRLYSVHKAHSHLKGGSASPALLKARSCTFDDVDTIVYDRNAGWSSLVARWAHNPKVGGSNPPPATNRIDNRAKRTRCPRHASLWLAKRAGCLGSANSGSSTGAPFSTMNATRIPSDGLFGGIGISRPAISEERSVTSNATCASSDEIGNRRVRFEAHPFHAELAFLVTDDKKFQVLQVGLPRLRFVRGNPMW